MPADSALGAYGRFAKFHPERQMLKLAARMISMIYFPMSNRIVDSLTSDFDVSIR